MLGKEIIFILFSVTSGSESTQPPTNPPSKMITDTIPVPVQARTGTVTDHSVMVVYIAVPVILAAIIISTAVIMYYKK